MKRHPALYGSAAALVAGGLMFAWHQSGHPNAARSLEVPPATAATTEAAVPPTPAESIDPLVAAGTLWEVDAENSREAQRGSLPVASEPLQNAIGATVGTQLELALSPRIAPLQATVKSRGVHDDGTVVTRLRIEGSPEGTLTLQENPETGFFIGHLFYDGGHPIAYEFHKKGTAIEATRRAVPELVCSELNKSKDQVALHGLPPIAQAGASVTPLAAPTVAKAPKIKGPVITVSNATVNETDSTAALTFTVRLSKANRKNPTTVNFATADGTAVAGTDYTSTSGVVTFPPKSTVQTITIPIPCDDLPEANKSFTLNLSNPVNASLVNTTATGAIIDDDALPTFSITDATVTEADTTNKQAKVTVSLNQAYVTTVRVFCATAHDSATAADYIPSSGTLVFNPGETSKVFAVSIKGDYLPEGSESFLVNLSNAQEGVILPGEAQGVVTILDNDWTGRPVPQHESLPGATAVIYLDMDGENVSNTLWNEDSLETIPAEGIESDLTPEQMTTIWQRVKEDFAPFKVNVTTREDVYLAANPGQRIRCIITPTSEWFGYAGGVAYPDSFTWEGDTPCWVFIDNLAYYPDYIAEAVSHEVGHSLGLEHDGLSEALEYYTGHGAGETSWAPIMGVGYYATLVQWSKGEYFGSNNTEDDLAIITGEINGFGYRTDEVGNSKSNATPLTVNDPPLPVNGATLSASGIIETREDVDVFSFTTSGGGAWFKVEGDDTSQNLDIEFTIYDSSGQPVVTVNPDRKTDGSASLTLAAGTYYIHVSGVGRGVPTESGYSDYGSLGQYTILGVAP
jgi:hypothetical protein